MWFTKVCSKQGTSIESGLIGNNLSTNVHVPVTVSPMNVCVSEMAGGEVKNVSANWERRMLSQSFDPVFFVICFVISTQNFVLYLYSAVWTHTKFDFQCAKSPDLVTHTLVPFSSNFIYSRKKKVLFVKTLLTPSSVLLIFSLVICNC